MHAYVLHPAYCFLLFMRAVKPHVFWLSSSNVYEYVRVADGLEACSGKIHDQRWLWADDRIP